MSENQNRWSTEKIIRYMIFTAIFCVALFKIISNSIDTIDVKNDYLITTGKIVEYKVFGVGPNRYLTYSYQVNGRNYTRKINGPNRTYDECAENLSLCSEKKFVVIYSKQKPSKSLIDVTREISSTQEIAKPLDLKSFQ